MDPSKLGYVFAICVGVNLEAVAMDCSAHARLGDAVKQWRRLTLLDPANARFAASYMEALAANGDRTAALTHGKSFVELMQREYETDADPAVQRLLNQLRDVEIVPPAPASPRVAGSDSPRSRWPPHRSASTSAWPCGTWTPCWARPAAPDPPPTTPTAARPPAPPDRACSGPSDPPA